MSIRRIYKDLDAPVPILFVDPMIFMMLILSVGIGIVAKQLLLGLVLATFVMWLGKIMSRGTKRGQAKHTAWRMGADFVDDTLTKHGFKPMQDDFVE